MLEILFWLFILAFVGGAAYVCWLYFQGRLADFSPATAIFGPKPERRLDIVEQSSLDGRRRLVLIRRDEIEHLIMTGGPVDVVIETNIQPKNHRGAKSADGPAGAPFSRLPAASDNTTGNP